ncbi:Hypothetical_protein [Hexamita inflata]|uniref:Hypothetical_protein n=1 Tax=Hexamita inflata TaxID=28002 RepID=A0ABP1LSI7_9EUKA
MLFKRYLKCRRLLFSAQLKRFSTFLVLLHPEYFRSCLVSVHFLRYKELLLWKLTNTRNIRLGGTEEFVLNWSNNQVNLQFAIQNRLTALKVITSVDFRLWILNRF